MHTSKCETASATVMTKDRSLGLIALATALASPACTPFAATDSTRSDGGSAASGIALVQATGQRSTSVAFARPVTAHNTIVVAVDVTPGAATPPTVITDSLQNRYSVLAGPYSVSGGLQLYLVAAFDVAGGPDTVNVMWTGPDYVDLYIHEYAGLALVDAVDATNTAKGSSDADPTASASVVVSAPNDLLFAFVGADAAEVNAGSSFSLAVPLVGNLTEDKVVEQPGTYSATATVTTSGHPWGVLLAALKGK
jgi:hypothetical protein